MYKCEICQKVVRGHIRCHKVVEKTRKKDYPVRAKAFAGYKERSMQKSTKTRDRLDDHGGSGWEIARELNCCPECWSKYKESEAIT